MVDVVIVGSAALAATLLGLWVLSVFIGKVSFIDAFWGTGFLVVAGAVAYSLPSIGALQSLALALLFLWGARLSLYLLRRYLSHGEDPRYVILTKNKTGLQRHLFTAWFVFGLQGILILLISAPMFAVLAAPPAPIDALALAGALLWLIGVFFEWTGDYQLSKFRNDPQSAGKVLDTGLWAWTRHPNYFGDACVWWGLWLVSHAPITFFAPALMTYLLMKWSGVPMLERSLKKSRPGYVEYCARTSNFFPRPPRKSPANTKAEESHK